MATYATTCGRSLEPICPAAEPNQPQREAAVLRLASRGLRLFPVQAPSKDPLIAEWPRKAPCYAGNSNVLRRQES
jgi:hypothetical protein